MALVELSSDGLTGPEKKAAALKAFYTIAEGIGFEVPGFVKTFLPTAIDAIVSVLNSLGIFKKKGLPAQEVPAPLK